MRITRTIAIFFVVPVAVQALLVGSMFVCFNDFGTTLKKQIEFKKLQAFLDSVQRLQSTSLGTALIASVTGYQRLRNKHDGLVEELKGLLPRLRQIERAHPELQTVIDDFIAKEKDLVGMELLIRGYPLCLATPSEEDSAQAASAIRQAMRSMKTVVAKVDDINAELQRNQSHALETGALCGALILLFELALAANWSKRTFGSRLQTVYNCIADFKQGKPLTPGAYSGDELTKLEDAIISADHRLRELEDSRRELSSIVAHDLRAPLTSIAGSLELMEETGMFGRLTEECQGTIAQARQDAEQLIFAVNLLLEFARLKSTDRLNVERVSDARLEDAIYEELDNAGLAGLPNFTCNIVDSGGALPITPLSKTVAFLIKALPPHEQVKLLIGKSNDDTIAKLEFRNKQNEQQQTSDIKLASVMASFMDATINRSTNSDGCIIEFTFKNEKASMSHSTIVSGKGNFRATFLLLLVATALLNLITAGCLVYAWHQGQLQLEREKVSRSVMHSASTITSDVTEIMFLSLLQVPNVEQERLRVQKKMDATMDWLDKFIPENKQSSMENWKSKIKAIQDVSRRLYITRDDPQAVTRLVKELVDKENFEQTHFSHSGQFIIEQEKAFSATSEKTWQLLQTLSMQITWISIVGTGASILCASLIGRHLIKRLNNVEENSISLQRGAKLQPPEKGNDEIAALDQFFFDAATTLERMERERQALVLLLRDELYLPISNLQCLITNLVETNSSGLSEKALKQMTVVDSELKRLSLLIDDLQCANLLGGESTDAIAFACVERDIRSIVESAVMATHHQANQKRVAIDVSSAPGKTTVNIDPQRTIQVLVNLLTNAIKVSQMDSSILVRIDQVEASARISVIDRGQGIPAEQVKQLFQRFSRLKDEKGSIGLGLFISKRLVEIQGGKIGVESVQGEGSTFWISFQIVASEK
ncbi:MAG: hypothetical protein K2X93_15160 [Candidatus Obscuribacterales bacterium]|nr:hypothetical protein [Candidatus Obscuribacterales bacterium]